MVKKTDLPKKLQRLIISYVLFGVILMDISQIQAYTKDEQVLIEKLRSHFGDKLNHEFMKTDEYLMRWLVAKKMDYDNAKDMLEKSLKWRKENNIDDILNEDFENFEKQFPAKMDAVDKDGHPVVYYHFGHWAPRKVAQSGQIPKLVRYMIKVLLEQPRMKAEELSKTSGKYNSKFVILTDLSGYSLKEHACLQCFGLYTQFVQLYENNYPESVHKVIVFNAPAIFEAILELVRPIMSPASKRDLSVLGVRKAEWKKTILNLVDPEQLPAQYGGSNKKRG